MANTDAKRSALVVIASLISHPPDYCHRPGRVRTRHVGNSLRGSKFQEQLGEGR